MKEPTFIYLPGIKAKNYQLVIVLVVIGIVHDLLFSAMTGVSDLVEESSFRKYGIATDIMISIILAPLFETVVFQFLLHRQLMRNKRLKENANKFTWIYVLASTALFAMSHFYSWKYILYAIFPGFLFAYFFNFFYYRSGYLKAITYIYVVHLVHNGIALIDEYLL